MIWVIGTKLDFGRINGGVKSHSVRNSIGSGCTHSLLRKDYQSPVSTISHPCHLIWLGILAFAEVFVTVKSWRFLLLSSFYIDIFIDPYASNSHIWSPSPSSSYSSSSYRNLMDSQSVPSFSQISFSAKIVWKVHGPLRLKAFCWEAVYKYVNTSDMLQRRQK